MDAGAVQALINTALTAQNTLHQQALDVANAQNTTDLANAIAVHIQALTDANAANALALQQAIVGLPAPVHLMKQAEGRYKIIFEKGNWAKPSKEEADLLVLTATVAAKQATLDKTDASSKPGDDANRSRHVPRQNNGEWAWKNVAPVGNQPREKTFKNKVYVACKSHKNTQWVLKEGHVNGCRNDPNFVTGVDAMMAKSKAEAEKKPPSKKALQFAHALMHAMEAEASGGLEEDESED
jgi:hypothetical protein